MFTHHRQERVSYQVMIVNKKTNYFIANKIRQPAYSTIDNQDDDTH